MEKTFAVTVLKAANSTSSSKSKKRNMKFPRTTEMSLLKYVMNCVLLQLLLDTKYSKAGLKRWHVQHHHYRHGSKVQEVRNIQVQKIPQVVQIPQVQQVKRFQRYSIKVNNPPILIFTNGLGIRMCAGCNNDITREQKEYPSNMVFWKKALVAFYNPKQNQMNIKDQNIHFHLNMQCLRQDDRTTEYRHLTTKDEIFKQLSLEEMEVLQKLDFLQFITENK